MLDGGVAPPIMSLAESMRATICSLFLSAWVGAAALAAGPTNSATCACPAEWLRKTVPATAVLIPVDRQGKHFTGAAAGFLISDDGILVTARHVCQAGAGLIVFTGKGTNRVAGYYGETGIMTWRCSS